MSGDDHGAGGDPAPVRDRASSTATRPTARPGFLVAFWQCVRSTSYILPEDPAEQRPGRGLPGRRVRDRAPPVGLGHDRRIGEPGRQELLQLPERPRAQRGLRRPAVAVQAVLSQRARARDEPDALRRVERLVDRGERRGGPRRAARRHLLLLARQLDQRPAWLLHGLGLPHALRRLQRVAHRRLPSGDAAHRRIRADHRQRGARVARRRIGIAGLLRRLHREHAHRCHRQPGRRHPHRRRAGSQRSRDLGPPAAG